MDGQALHHFLMLFERRQNARGKILENGIFTVFCVIAKQFYRFAMRFSLRFDIDAVEFVVQNRIQLVEHFSMHMIKPVGNFCIFQASILTTPRSISLILSNDR